MNKNLVKSDVVEHELRVKSLEKHELKFKSAISSKVLLPGIVSFSTSYQWWLIRQLLLINASFLLVSAYSPPRLPPPNSHIKNKVIPGCIGIEMLLSLQMFSSFRCLFVVRFEWNIVLSSSHDIRKAWIHQVMSLRRYFYSPKLRLILSKAGANSGDLLWVSSFKVEVAWS